MLEARSCAWLAGLWFVASLGHVHTQDSLSLSIMNVSVTTTSEPPPVKVCFTGITMDISGEILIYLNCGDSTSNEDSVEGTTVTKNNDDKSICSEHLMTLAIYKPNLNCIITVYNKDNPDLQEHGEVIFDMPAKENFPDCTFGGKWTDLNLLALLCQPVGDPNFNLLSEDGFTRVVDSTNIIYYTTTTTPIATSVSLCMDEEGSTVNNNPATLKLCSGSVTVSDFTATGSDPLVANLKYEPSTSNTGTLEVSGAKDCDTNTCDLLTKNNDYVATTAATPSTTLTNLITRTSPPSNTDYLVLQYSMDSSTGGFKQSQYGVHTDYDVKTTVIETDILEVYWTSADDTSYGMSYTDAGGSTVSATVLCAVADTYCFGYFVKVPADTYSVSVSSSNGKNVITVPSVAIPSPAPKNEGYQDVVATLTIDTFIITSVATPSTITVCFGKGDLPLTPLKENVHLTCSAGTPSEISSEATSVTAAADNSILCSTHNIPSGDNVLDPNLHCILSVNNENQVPLGSSEVILAMPGALFDCSSPFLMSEANIMGMQCSARGDISNVVIDVDTDSYLVLDVTDATAVSTSYILIGSSSKVPSIDKDVLICYQVNNGAATSEFVKVCSSAGLKIDATKDLGIDKATETYTSSGGVKLTATLSDSALDSYDILAIDSSAFMCAGNKDTACTLTGYDRKQELAYIVVSGAPPSVKYQQGSVQGYNMVGSWLSTSTIEVNWINPTKSSPFTIKKEPTGGTFDSATVDCEDTDIYCYGYFTELPAGSYTVTLTPDSGKESVIGEPISNTLAIKGLQVQEVRLDWSIDSVRANASVCFNEDVARDPEGRKEYRVVLVDAQGHWLRAQEASQKREGALCFSGAAVDTRKFNTVDKVTVLVTRVGEDGRTALAHGEAHLFFMTPETEGVGGRVGRVTLGNPGGYTFTVRREGDPAPVTTSTTGRFVHYFVPRTTGPEVERLVVETEGLDVKMTTVVPLTPHVVPGMWSSSTLVCTHSGSCP